MEHIKEAFFKVKQDIDSLKEEVFVLRKELEETRKSLIEVCEILKNNQKEKVEVPTQKEQILTEETSIPTDNSVKKALNTQNLGISTGNEGVPTDRQTDRQTDQHIDKGSYKPKIILKEDSIKNALQLLDSLDNLKKELRLKFKRLTEQELLVFSKIYQESEEKGHTDYKNLSKYLNLTESSIRDYVGRLITKGIPLEKIKVNNKTIHLSISQNLRRIASLATILQLREI